MSLYLTILTIYWIILLIFLISINPKLPTGSTRIIRNWNEGLFIFGWLSFLFSAVLTFLIQSL